MKHYHDNHQKTVPQLNNHPHINHQPRKNLENKKILTWNTSENWYQNSGTPSLISICIAGSLSLRLHFGTVFSVWFCRKLNYRFLRETLIFKIVLVGIWVALLQIMDIIQETQSSEFIMRSRFPIYRFWFYKEVNCSLLIGNFF